MRIPADVLQVLTDSRVDGNMLFLPSEQLDRKLYVETDKILVAMGGKWKRNLKGHLFEESPELTLQAALESGEQVDPKKQFQFFETPDPLALAMIKNADIGAHHVCLEPSAGRGAIAKHLPKDATSVIDFYKPNADFLFENGYHGTNTEIHSDFLSCSETPERGYGFDRIVMNPPFCRNQDIAHIRHAYSLLSAGGRLVSIAGEGAFSRTTKTETGFREWLADVGGKSVTLPRGTFSKSGTEVASRMLVINKQAAA